MSKRILALFIGLIGLSTACGSQGTVINGEKVELEDGLYAKIQTNKGDILFKFEAEKAPQTTANFIALAEGNHPLADDKFAGKPFFDGLTFHRVIPEFMIQGGDPDGTGGGSPGYKFNNETDNDLEHVKGAVSMANAGPNTNGSQFFITVAPTPFLNGNYSIFGKVVKGQEVADSISMVKRNPSDKPNEDVVMEKVTIIRKGQAAKDFDAPTVFMEYEEKAKQAIEEAKKRQQTLIDSLTEGATATGSGLYYVILEEGKGPKPNEGQTVKMNYSGKLIDGKMFDTSIESVAKENNLFNPQRPYEPLEVVVGPQARVIEGWKEALSLMKVGDKYRLIIPPSLGYGERGYPPVIPANAYLIFDVEMVGIK